MHLSHMNSMPVLQSLNIFLRELQLISVPEKKQGIFIFKAENPNNDTTVLKGSTASFNTKTPTFMIYSLTDPSWNFLPEFLDEINLKNGPLIGDNTIIILPKSKKNEAPSCFRPRTNVSNGREQDVHS